MEKIELSNIENPTQFIKINVKKYTSLSNEAVCKTFNDIIDDISTVKQNVNDYYIHLSGEPDKAIGELNLSGDLTLSSVLNLASRSSFIMTDDPVWNANYASHSGYLQCSKGDYNCFRPLGDKSLYKIKDTSKIGGCIGALAYCILSGYNDSNNIGHLKLSGDIIPLLSTYENDFNKDNWNQVKWSLAYGGYGDQYQYTINVNETSTAYKSDLNNGIISAHWVTLNENIGSSLNDFLSTEESAIATWNTDPTIKEDDNVFYSPIAPWAGNQICKLMYGQHAEGTTTRAICRGAHTEGQFTLADGRYSHCEGSKNIAAGCGAHAEGYQTLAYEYAHSEGGQTQAIGSYSHAQNQNCIAKGADSTACGYGATAQGKCTFCWSGTYYGAQYGDKKELSSDGLFLINPKGGTNGFYIGNQSLAQLLEKPLKGEDYTLSTVENIMIALSAVIVALGGTVQIPPEVETKNN